MNPPFLSLRTTRRGEWLPHTPPRHGSDGRLFGPRITAAWLSRVRLFVFFLIMVSSVPG
ncbi:hypothetical protein E2C01_032801 [Portunus trituberculatus]|uniref:Uncharacterized protein n=1 Tax=Portunus trituberculatus TaxID=210409 RepID=A0A5B7EW71_PORTR|nr:hypothetical protein [Portunus trituberculatus]